MVSTPIHSTAWVSSMRSLVLSLIACALVACDSKPDGVVLIAAYGDSTQFAQGDPHASNRPGWTIINKGIRGSNTVHWKTAWAEEMKSTKAQIVIYNGGLNDGGMGVEKYKSYLREMERIARSHGKRFLLEQPNNAVAHPLFSLARFNERRSATRDIAASIGAHYCEQPDVPLRDGAHPTAEGYRMKAERLADCIRDVLGWEKAPDH